MKSKCLLIAFITLLVCGTEVSWHETYISVHGAVLIMGDHFLRAVKWGMWGLICYRILDYKEKENNDVPHKKF